MHFSRIRPFFYFSAISIAILVQLFIWFISGQVEIKFMNPITRKAEPFRYWAIISSGLAVGVISLGFFIFKGITDSTWQ